MSACLGVSLGLLDTWLSTHASTTPAATTSGSADAVLAPPASLSKATRVPTGKWAGQRAATDVLALARKGRAFDSLGSLITRQGSPGLLAGCVLALAGAVKVWADTLDLPVIVLAREVIR